jgi:hypothetical protein
MSQYIELHMKNRGTPRQFRVDHITSYCPNGPKDATDSRLFLTGQTEPITVEESYAAINLLVDGE